MARDVLTKNEQATQTSRGVASTGKEATLKNRQPTILQLQRMVGNRAMQRMMGASALQSTPQLPQEHSLDVEAPDHSQSSGSSRIHPLQRAAGSPPDGNNQSPNTGQPFLARTSSGLVHPLLANVLQTKLQVSQPDDPYEREADEVADHVMAQRQVTMISRLSSGSLSRISQEAGEGEKSILQPTIIQRQETEEKEPVQLQVKVQRQSKEDEDSGPLQTSRLQRQSDDQEELLQTQSMEPEEAEKETSLQTQLISRKANSEEQDDPLQLKSAPDLKTDDDGKIQRASVDEETEDLPVQTQRATLQPTKQQEENDDSSGSVALQRQKNEEELVQTKSQGNGSTSSTDRDEPVYRALQNSGSGSPMHPETKSRLETSLGTDLSGVRVHEGHSSQQANTALNARAFANGNNIWLGKGESQTDLRLMAHETTHVLQQEGADKLERITLQRKSQEKCPGCGSIGKGSCQTCSQGTGRIQRKVSSSHQSSSAISIPLRQEKNDVVVNATEDSTKKHHLEKESPRRRVSSRDQQAPNKPAIKKTNGIPEKKNLGAAKEVEAEKGNRQSDQKQESQRANLTKPSLPINKEKRTATAAVKLSNEKGSLDSKAIVDAGPLSPQGKAPKLPTDVLATAQSPTDLGRAFSVQKEKRGSHNFSSMDPLDALSVMQEYLAAQPKAPAAPLPVKSIVAPSQAPVMDSSGNNAKTSAAPQENPPPSKAPQEVQHEEPTLTGEQQGRIEHGTEQQEEAFIQDKEGGKVNSQKTDAVGAIPALPKETLPPARPPTTPNGDIPQLPLPESAVEAEAQYSNTEDVSLTVNQPPDDQSSNELRAPDMLVQRTSTTHVQRDVDIDDVIPDWVMNAFNSLRTSSAKEEQELTSDATGKKGDLDSDSTSKANEIQGHGETKGEEVRTQGETKGEEVNKDGFGRVTELQGEQLAKTQELQNDQTAQSQELQAGSAAKKQELQQGKTSKQSELESQQEMKAQELKGQALTKEAELQSQAKIKGEELQSDAETKSDEITGYWTDTTIEAERQKEEISTQANAERIGIEQQALVVHGVVQNRWSDLEGQAKQTIQGLDSEAGELCARYQGKAQEYLEDFDPIIERAQQGWKKLKNAAKKEWDSFMKKAGPHLEAIREGWEIVSTWASKEVWDPLKKRAGELASKVSQKVGVAWEWGKRKWAWLNECWTEAKELLFSRGDAAREWIGEKAHSARAWIEEKAYAANDWIANKAEGAREWIHTKAQAAEEWVTNKAEGARGWIGEKASGALSWITGKTGAAREWVGGKTTAAKAWINNATATAKIWIKGKGDDVTNWFKDKGQGLVSGVSSSARDAVSTVSEYGGPIGEWLGGKVNSVISGVESVGNRAVTGVTNTMNLGLNFVESKVSSAIGYVGDKATGAVNWVDTTSNLVLNTMETTCVTAVNVLQSTATQVTNGIATTASGAINLAKQGSISAVNGLENTAHGAVGFLHNVAMGTVNKAEQAGNAAVDGIENAVKAAAAFAYVIWEGHKTVWGGLWEGIKWYYSSLWEGSIEFGKWAWNDFIKPSVKWVNEKWKKLEDWVQKTFPGLTACWEVFEEYADATWEKIKKLPIVGTVVDAYNTFVNIRAQIIEGALKGDLIDDPTGWNIVGQVLIGFVPYAGQVADVRDLLVAIEKAKNGEPGAWMNLVLNVVAFAPGLGDAIKGAKGLKHVDKVADATRAATKAVKEAAPEAIDDAAKAGKKSIDETGDASKAADNGKKSGTPVPKEEAAEYAKAVLALQSFTQAQDVRNASIPELMSELNLLKRRFSVTKHREITFKQKPAGHYEILMREVLDPHYTPTGPEPRTPEAQKFIDDYKRRYPDTTLSDEVLEKRFKEGYEINPETGRLNKPSNDLGFDSTTPEMRKRVEGSGYLDPRNNEYKSAPPGEIMSPDHILPVKRIKEMDGFDDLTRAQKKAIIHDTDGIGNIQPLPKSMNESKGGRLADDWKKYGKEDVSEEYRRNLKKEQDRLEREIQKKIDKYTEENKRAAGG